MPTQAPKPLAKPDFSGIEAMIKESVESVAADGYAGKDIEQYVFEAVLVAVYGKNIWKWWNANNPV